MEFYLYAHIWIIILSQYCAVCQGYGRNHWTRSDHIPGIGSIYKYNIWKYHHMMTGSNWTQQTTSIVKNELTNTLIDYLNWNPILPGEWFHLSLNGSNILFINYTVNQSCSFFKIIYFLISIIVFINLSTEKAKYIKGKISVPPELSFYRTHNSLYDKVSTHNSRTLAVSGSLRSQKYYFLSEARNVDIFPTNNAEVVQ